MDLVEDDNNFGDLYADFDEQLFSGTPATVSSCLTERTASHSVEEEENGTNKHMIPTRFVAEASSHDGCKFFPPRNRRKPWWNHGIDIADYSNSGLSEEGWNNYCRSLEILRNQTHSLSRVSRKPNQLQRMNVMVGSKRKKSYVTGKSECYFSCNGSSQFQKDIPVRNMEERICIVPARSNVEGRKLQDRHAGLDDAYFSEPEEGELIEGAEYKDLSSASHPKFEGNKKMCCKDVSSTKIVQTCGEDTHILTMLAMMDRRRERFKEPLTVKEKHVVECHQFLQSDQVMKERPTRRRRWGGM